MASWRTCELYLVVRCLQSGALAWWLMETVQAAPGRSHPPPLPHIHTRARSSPVWNVHFIDGSWQVVDPAKIHHTPSLVRWSVMTRAAALLLGTPCCSQPLLKLAAGEHVTRRQGVQGWVAHQAAPAAAPLRLQRYVCQAPLGWHGLWARAAGRLLLPAVSSIGWVSAWLLASE